MDGRIDSMEFARSCVYKVSRFIEKKFDTKAMSTPLSYPLDMKPEKRFGLVAEFSQRHAAVAARVGKFWTEQSCNPSAIRPTGNILHNFDRT